MNVGYFGAGKMSALMAATIAQMGSAKNCAVAAQSLPRAQQFAKEHGFKKAYGSYEELAKDPEIDLVYIATTNCHHFPHAMLALKHKKPVLCEKPFTQNLQEAKDLLCAFKKEGVFITEAIWPRYMPFAKTICQLVQGGIVGTPRLLTANLGYAISHLPRLQQPALGGGALLDLGVYTLTFASMLFGDNISKMHSTAVLTADGVDEHSNITLNYADGKMAVLTSTMAVCTNRQGIIYGSNGMLVVDNINNPLCARLYSAKQELIKEYTAPPQISGYEYQVMACEEALKNKELECEDMPHSQTLLIMQWMSQIKEMWD